ncbi:hypothetical protein Q73_07580 [Bacillus coahuilensis m2-6]|uniref:hypothetical protein n=1 Tax=Bacillus coahuilensis TaxID=408580 RepID=UPI0007505699|nr:hypothetical protein [Bacillus coahuilensis]KUP08076.1 hypothetical protein Q73_07580 [Bacillus coahuilensis m2-6]
MDSISLRSNAERYRVEFENISDILNRLEAGVIYELTGDRVDGTLSENVRQLRTKLNELHIKIEREEDSIYDKIEAAIEEHERIEWKQNSKEE